MATHYVLDACALLEADNGNAQISMNQLNFFEVYYGIRRDDGTRAAEEVYNMVMRLPITIIKGMTTDVFHEAARIKTSHRMSLADAIALGEASVRGATIITSDHHEFDTVEVQEKIAFAWIR